MKGSEIDSCIYIDLTVFQNSPRLEQDKLAWQLSEEREEEGRGE